MVMSQHEQGWNWNKLSKNPSITYDVIKANPTYPWNLAKAAKNKSIPIETVISHPELWSRYVSDRFDLTWKIIHNNPQMPWEWGRLRLFIEKNIYAKYFGRKWRFIIKRRKNRHKANFIHVLDHLKLYVRDKMAGTLVRSTEY